MKRNGIIAVRRAFAGLPMVVRVGAMFLGLGIVADLVYHLTHGVTSHAHATGGIDAPLLIHLTVALGMAVSMVGVTEAGIRSIRSRRQP